MAEVLAEYADVLMDGRGRSYRARACGSEMPGGGWQGWLEFVPLDDRAVIRSGRETTQPNRADTLYWATGLTTVYLDGALHRALRPLVIRDREPHPSDGPAFDEPAAPLRTSATLDAQPAVLDPFSVYEKGEALLRRQLSAFSAWQLVRIVEGYRLSSQPTTVLNRLPVPSLVEIIVGGVVAQHSPR